MSKRFLLLVVVLLITSTAAHAQRQVVRLYPGKAPGSEQWSVPESVTEGRSGATIANVNDPSFTVYAADPAKATGVAVIVCPGGAFRYLSWAEGTRAAEWLNAKGITAFVLKYRTLQGVQAPAPQLPAGAMPAGGPPSGNAAPAAPGPGRPGAKEIEIRNANANPDPTNEPLNTVIRMSIADAQTAMRMIRARASEWRIDPNRLGIMGFSAGGGTAVGTALADKGDAYPNFVVSVYGPSQMDVVVPPHAAPLFIAVGTFHPNVASGCLALFAAWKAAGKPVELHAYDGVNGPFGVNRTGLPVDAWLDRFYEWLGAKGIVDSRK